MIGTFFTEDGDASDWSLDWWVSAAELNPVCLDGTVPGWGGSTPVLLSGKLRRYSQQDILEVTEGATERTRI